jgi:hypothetical protein
MMSVRDEFRQRFPAQAEHIMRLVSERLHNVLVAKPIDMTDPSNWRVMPHEIKDLTEALYYMNLICKDMPYNDHQ